MLALKDEYSDDTYEFEILGTYPYPASFTLFISNSRFEELFDKEEGYFNGYFSNEELTDLDSKAVAVHLIFFGHPGCQRPRLLRIWFLRV